MSAHSVPLHCCYCGGEDLFPHAGEGELQPGGVQPGGVQHGGAQPGGWECRECLRVFRVSFVGLAVRGAGAPR